MKIGYARVSSTSQEQAIEIQLEALQNAGCDRIISEIMSGTKMENRAELNGLLAIVRAGDEVWITRLDRIARSVGDLIKIVEAIEKAGASLHAIEQPIETKTSAGRLFLTMLGAFAQFETEIRKERQAEGIRKAVAAHKYKGNMRGPSHDRGVIEKLYFDHNMRVYQIAKHIGATRQTIYRALEEIKAKRAKESAREEVSA